MYARELIYLMYNGGEVAGNEIDETIHMTAEDEAEDEAEDDVKIYIRHSIGESTKELN